MARIGLRASDDVQLYHYITDYMEIARTALKRKREVIEELTEKGLYPYSAYYLDGVKQRFGEYWANHFNTIGLIGVHECCLNYIGKPIVSDKGKWLAESILNHMNMVLERFQEEDDMLYNLEASPAEGASYRLARLDKAQYGSKAHLSGEQNPYYTNSTQVPVDWTRSLPEALNHQDSLQTKYTGGTVLHAFLGDEISPEVAAATVKTIAENYELPYFSLTPTFSICPQHNYIAGEHFECPECGEGCEVWSRVVGYYRPVQAWNDGKQAEYGDRETFDL